MPKGLKKMAAKTKLDALKEDFAATEGAPFAHFYCPILLVDENARLCDGHILNEALPNCARTTVVQREDVDNFYGRIESEFVTLISSKGSSLGDIFFDSTLHKKLRPRLSVNGETVVHYPDLGTKCPPNHSRCQFERGDGQVFDFVIKKPPDEMSTALDHNWEIVIDRCYIAPAVASLIKAAHLTLFHMLGYRHVTSTAGRFVADILKQCFYKFRHSPDRELRKNVDLYFEPYHRMVWPLQIIPSTTMKGTVTDRKAFCCWASSNTPFALGVTFGQTMYFMR